MTPAADSKRRRRNSTPEKNEVGNCPAVADFIEITIEDTIRSVVNEYVGVIKDQQALIQAQSARIQDLEDKLAASTPSAPKSTLDDSVVRRLLQKDDDLEQQSRKKSLRLTGVKESVQQGQSTDTIVVKIAEELGVDISAGDIDLSHFNSKPDNEKGRVLLIQFKDYKNKVKFISQRKKLRTPGSKFSSVYINEDLTTDRYQLLRKLIHLKQSPSPPLHSCWSFDGKLFYKKREDDAPIRIRNPLFFEPATDL